MVSAVSAAFPSSFPVDGEPDAADWNQFDPLEMMKTAL